MMDQTVILDILLGHRQRVIRDIHRVHFRFREGVGAGDSDAAAAGAHIEDMARRVGDQAGEAVFNQFADRRARHQHAFVDIELVAAEPGFISEVGNRYTLVDAADNALNDAVTLAGGKARAAHIFRNIQRQPERGQDQLYRFVPRIVGAVTVPDPGGGKTADRPAQHILNGVQFVDCLIDENFVHVALRRPNC